MKYINKSKVLHFSHLDHAEYGICACPVMNGEWELTLVLSVSLSAR